MKERPILFSAPMVRAILEGRKTVTRRVMRTQPNEQWSPDTYGEIHKMRDGDFVMRDGAPVVMGWGPCNADGEEGYMSPYGQPGDRLWVREAWRSAAGLDDLSGKQIDERCVEAGYRLPWAPLQYDADGFKNEHWHGFGDRNGSAAVGRYRHARFMPRWASRITLEVTGVRVERLHDISTADIGAEGIQIPCAADTGNMLIDVSTPNGAGSFLIRGQYSDAAAVVRAHWAALWCSINGRESWDANPWVWVVEFKRTEQLAA